jgi:hypothetical protein
MMRARSFGRAALLVLSLASLFGCEDDLPKASLLSHMRVLGARTEVVGDEMRSTPRPGETARLTWTVAFPDYDTSQDELSSLFLVCTAPSRFTGTPVCQEIVDVATGRGRPIGGLFGSQPMGCDVRPDSVQTVGGIRLYCVSGRPELEVKIDRNVEADRLIQGVICRNGIPQFDLQNALGVSCVGKAGVDPSEVEQIAVYGTIGISKDTEEENLNPDLGRMRLGLRAEKSSRAVAWNPTPAEQLPELIQDCSQADSSVVLSSNGYPGVIELSYPEDAESKDEDLVFSTYATYGDLSRRFTVIDAESGRDPDEPDQTWELSEDERDKSFGEPKLVRFYFTVLDGRGGFDITTRELCVNRREGG